MKKLLWWRQEKINRKVDKDLAEAKIKTRHLESRVSRLERLADIEGLADIMERRAN